MHLTRKAASPKLPLTRKGTKYIAVASSNYRNSVPVIIALRDLLGLAKTSKEVKQMVHQKLLKINGKEVRDTHESIEIFDILHAGKDYVLTLLPTKKFAFEEAKNHEHLCKVTGRSLVRDGKIQVHLHDGTNIIANDKIKVNDSLYLDFENKIKKHISFEKANDGFIISGKYAGQHCKIEKTEKNKVLVKLNEKAAEINACQVVAL